jgi:hypothetical protein
VLSRCYLYRSVAGILADVFVVHATKKFLERAPRAATTERRTGDEHTGRLLRHRPVLAATACSVRQRTNTPTLLLALAPAATVIARMTQTAAAVFTAPGLPEEFTTREITAMGTHQLTKTANRSVLGTMNDFAHLAEAHTTAKNPTDLVELSLRLAQTPCGPLYRSHISPDHEIATYVTQHTH